MKTSRIPRRNPAIAPQTGSSPPSAPAATSLPPAASAHGDSSGSVGHPIATLQRTVSSASISQQQLSGIQRLSVLAQPKHAAPPIARRPTTATMPPARPVAPPSTRPALASASQSTTKATASAALKTRPSALRVAPIGASYQTRPAPSPIGGNPFNKNLLKLLTDSMREARMLSDAGECLV